MVVEAAPVAAAFAAAYVNNDRLGKDSRCREGRSASNADKCRSKTPPMS